MFVIHSIRFPACLCLYLRLDDPVAMLRPHIRESTFSFSPCHIFFPMCLSSENTNGLNQTQTMSWRLTTSSHLLIDPVLPLNPTYLSQSTHSRNFSQTQAFLFLFFIRKTLFANLFSHHTIHFSTSFFLACINNCYSTLMPLTDIHSHHNLTIHTLYPICTLRDRLQISWLFKYVHCIHNAKTEVETKADHKH